MIKLIGKVEENYDMYNSKKKRNLKNTDRNFFNCGGYALNTMNWYCPYEEHKSFCGMVIEMGIIEATKYMMNFILEDIPNIRLIQEVSELQENEYAVAFRICGDDFHFLKRGKNGIWYQKMGAKHYLNTMSATEVFSDRWNWRYNGPVVLFAKVV